MTSNEIRQQFLDFFRAKGHEIVPSSPVVPLDDPTLMFTNAGMNQFKDVFLGTGSRSYARAADTQKCIRAGGKHNDLDDVGQDTYHHTFFEMLGNWSFGDYFKTEAIGWAWELLTEVWGIEKDRLHATYFQGDERQGLEPDNEAAQLWRSVTDINPDNIHPGDKKDNFWEMGDTGPCGPCSEIHIDLTPDKSGRALVNAGDANVIELWNLVFIQFNRSPDGKLTPLPAKHVDTGLGFERLCAVLNGKKSNYDTDVFAPIFQAIQRRTNAPDYQGTIPGDGRDEGTEGRRHEGTEARRHEGEDVVRTKPAPDNPAVPQTMIDVTYRVIADHLRCLTFAITDGAIPSNEGRGYVLRRILRRAVRYGRQYFGMEEPFLCDLVQPLIDQMADVFPELRTAHAGTNIEHVTEILRDEERAALDAIIRGEPLWWQAAVAAVSRSAAEDGVKFNGPLPRSSVGTRGPVKASDAYSCNLTDEFDLNGSLLSFENFSSDIILRHLSTTPVISGDDAFKLHDTHGFLIDLTSQMAHERGLKIDLGEYERLMEEARKRAKRSLKRAEAGAVSYSEGLSTDDSFKYHTLELEAEVTIVGAATSQGNQWSIDLTPGDTAEIHLNRTPFYAEQGGQVGDAGSVEGPDWLFRVTDTVRGGKTIAHVGFLESGHLRVNLTERNRIRVVAKVDPSSRSPTMKNHTSTHLLNWALREVLGDRVQQKGSLVDPEKTRFDFSHNKPATEEELVRVEGLVNERIAQSLAVSAEELPLDVAQRINGVRAVFGEKYPNPVRVVCIGKSLELLKGKELGEVRSVLEDAEWRRFSVEFCGGTHLKNTAEAERFVLTTEEAVAKGIRRVVGISGQAARDAEAAGKQLLLRTDALLAHSKEPRAAARAAVELNKELPDLQNALNETTIPVRVAFELRERIAELQRIAKKQSKAQASAAAGDVMAKARTLLEEAQTIGDTRIIVGEVPAAAPDALRSAIDWFRQKTESSAVLLICRDDNKVTLLAGMSRDVVKRGVKAGDLIKEIAPLVGGKGGGRPDMAQGGGGNPGAIPAALDQARSWLTQSLS
ncbi:MAG: alanine--tRNA ligase [Phycisphaerae bacterium]